MKDYNENGYMLFTKVVPKKNIIAAQKECRTAFKISCDLKKTEFVQGAKFVKPFHEKNPEICLRIEWVEHLFKNIASLVECKKVMSKMVQITGCSSFDKVISQLNYRIPRDKSSYEIHRDLQKDKGYFNDENDIDKSIIIAIGLSTFNSKASPLVVFPKSHLPGYSKKLEDLNLCDGVEVPLGEGDVLMFHPALLHGSGGNDSDVARYLNLSLFVPAGSYKRVSPDFSLSTRIENFSK